MRMNTLRSVIEQNVFGEAHKPVYSEAVAAQFSLGVRRIAERMRASIWVVCGHHSLLVYRGLREACR